VSIRVFLLDDHQIVRAGIRLILELHSDLTVVGEADTAATARILIPQVHPDVAILDVRLPDGDGIDICRELRSSHPEVACLMLTSYSDNEALANAAVAGAAGYVLKQIRADDLVGKVRAVGSGQTLISPADVRQCLGDLRKINEESSDVDRLTHREREIFDLISLGKTNRQIAAELFLAESTVKNYVSNLLTKLGMVRRTEAAARAGRLAGRREQVEK
jgi:DNA-binding NarL/FixJ family response regulator